jgi:hypothetical protein
MIAALYVDVKRGPYAGMPGVDAWGLERDATTYAGPWPVVAHPPCAHWGRLKHFSKDDGHTGPIAVAQVRQFGGVLEHPEHSSLWPLCGMPEPGWLPDEFGGYSVHVRQFDFGHLCDKWTWLYIVGVPVERLPPMPPRRAEPATHVVTNEQRKGDAGYMPRISSALRHITPPAFAEWLVELARRVKPRTGME